VSRHLPAAGRHCRGSNGDRLSDIAMSSGTLVVEVVERLMDEIHTKRNTIQEVELVQVRVKTDFLLLKERSTDDEKINYIT